MYHRNHGELQLMLSERESVAIVYLNNFVSRLTYVVVTAHHVECLLVAHDFSLRIIFLYQGQ